MWKPEKEKKTRFPLDNGTAVIESYVAIGFLLYFWFFFVLGVTVIFFFHIHLNTKNHPFRYSDRPYPPFVDKIERPLPFLPSALPPPASHHRSSRSTRPPRLVGVIIRH